MSGEAPDGLSISFINVGDGDAILIRDVDHGKCFTMLVDTGREDVHPTPDSCRAPCRDFLCGLGIKRIDALVITHLHEDHAGGLRRIMQDIDIDSLYSSYIPAGKGQCADEPQGLKTVRGLISCLNRWTEDVEILKKRGARMISVGETTKLALTRRLTAEITVRDTASAEEQHNAYDRMLCGDALSQEQKIAASKLRNANSLRIRLRFAGREVELAADCYGSLWENEAVKCDLFKVPHHGDAKALTALLVNALKPKNAVISCAAEYIPEKDRPSAETARILREAGARVWYVDSFSDGVETAVRRKSLNFSICADGRMLSNV